MSDKKPDAQPIREDFERALQSMGTFMDIGIDDLMTLAERAQHFARQRENESLSVSRIMSHPVHFIHEETSMSDAAHLMVTHRISGLPVVDDDERLVGIITEADFLRGLGVPTAHPAHNLWQTLESLFSHLAKSGDLDRPTNPVSDLMVRDVVCTSGDRHVDDVIQVMKQHRVKRVPVCDGAGKVRGIVTRSDLVRIFFDRYQTHPKDSQTAD